MRVFETMNPSYMIRTSYCYGQNRSSQRDKFGDQHARTNTFSLLAQLVFCVGATDMEEPLDAESADIPPSNPS